MSTARKTDLAARQIVISRLINAPRELVFDVFASKDHLENWWGPRGFRNTIHELNFKPGGVWRFTMHGPDGKDYPNKVVFDEIKRPERLTWAHGSDVPEGKEDAQAFDSEVTFEDRGGKTLLTLRLTLATAAQRDETAKYALEGGNQHLDRFEEQLAIHQQPKTSELVLTRVVRAPAALVYAAWTEPKHLEKWWGPAGLEVKVQKLELKPGGTFLYSMKVPNGPTMFGKFVYREVVPHKRLAFVVSFCDAEGTILRHPMSATWPLEVLNDLTLTEFDGRTTLVLRGGPHNAEDAAVKTFMENFANVEKGFSGTFAQLEKHLADVQAG